MLDDFFGDFCPCRKESITWSPFAALGKAVGSGVDMVGKTTKAVGEGVVQGTKVSRGSAGESCNTRVSADVCIQTATWWELTQSLHFCLNKNICMEMIISDLVALWLLCCYELSFF